MADTQALKDLTQATYDTLEAYRRAHDMAHTEALRRTLEDRISARVRTVNMLNEALAERQGGKIDHTSAPAQAAEVFRSIGEALQDGDEAAAHRIENAEQDLYDRYDSALAGDEFEGSLRSIVESAAREVREGESVSHVLERQYG